ncbi:MAG: hypothetical protein H7246_16380 [Phycisphaerae bacterium]|nr:hypothetical protein [Saprospiraceae bacterium]
MTNEKKLQVLDSLIERGNALTSKLEKDQYDTSGALTRQGSAFLVECLEATSRIIGKDSPYYENFESLAKGRINHFSIDQAVEYLGTMKNTIDY